VHEGSLTVGYEAAAADAGFLPQFANGGLLVRLASVEAAARRDPERMPAGRGIRAEQQEAVARVEQQDAGGFAPGAMSRDEALRILGLAQGADETAIKAAHRHLMTLMHPDRGGSSYLAAKINQARDTLLDG
jgi:DnaJ-domain-containing protein 1